MKWKKNRELKKTKHLNDDKSQNFFWDHDPPKNANK